MATITDYNSLEQALQDFTARSDLVSYQDYFIQAAEEDIYNSVFEQNQGRGLPDFETSFTGTISGNTLALPTGYLGLRAATFSDSGNNFPLQMRPLDWINQNYPDTTASSPPSFICRAGTNFQFAPYPDSGYTVNGWYWQRMAALSSSNTTTWMTSNIPATLFAACMKELYDFVQDAANAEKWDTRYQSRLAAYIASKHAEDYSGSGLSMAPA